MKIVRVSVLLRISDAELRTYEAGFDDGVHYSAAKAIQGKEHVCVEVVNPKDLRYWERQTGDLPEGTEVTT